MVSVTGILRKWYNTEYKSYLQNGELNSNHTPAFKEKVKNFWIEETNKHSICWQTHETQDSEKIQKKPSHPQSHTQ